MIAASELALNIADQELHESPNLKAEVAVLRIQRARLRIDYATLTSSPSHSHVEGFDPRSTGQKLMADVFAVLG